MIANYIIFRRSRKSKNTTKKNQNSEENSKRKVLNQMVKLKA